MAFRRNQWWEDVKKGEIDLGEAVQHFDTYNRSEGKSPRTVEWYDDVLDLFQHWLRSEGLSTKLGSLGELEVRRSICYNTAINPPAFLLRCHGCGLILEAVNGMQGSHTPQRL